MSEQPEPSPRARREKEEILRDFTVASRLRDIQNTAELKERLAPHWWETVIGVLQFAATLGLLASAVQFPPLRQMMFGRLLVFWFALTILSLILGFEFVIFRLHHLRRAFEVALRLNDQLEQRVAQLERQVSSEEKASASPPEE